MFFVRWVVSAFVLYGACALAQDEDDFIDIQEDSVQVQKNVMGKSLSKESVLESKVQELEMIVERLQKRLSDLEQKVLGKPSVSGVRAVPVVPAQSMDQGSHPPGWQQGPLAPGLRQAAESAKANEGKNPPPLSPPFQKRKDEAQAYRMGQKALSDGEVERARQLFQQVHDAGQKHSIEAGYWLGIIALMHDENSKAASLLLSKTYQACEKSQKPILFKQAVLLKLAEALMRQNEMSSCKVILDKFFELNKEPLESDSSKDRQKRQELFSKAQKMRLMSSS